MERKKISRQLDTPYSTVQWPNISDEHQDVLLDLLCNLLAPIGEYRKEYVIASKGKRSKSRKRKRDNQPDVKSQRPAPPDIFTFVDVGLAQITRTLQEAMVNVNHTKDKPTGVNPTSEEKDVTAPKPPPYAVVFVPRSGQATAFHCHFPQTIAAASKLCGNEGEPIRLVGFSKACEERLSASLGIPRVSSIAIRASAPHSRPLVDFAREHVPILRVPWLDEAISAQYLPTKINTIETVVGTKAKK